MVLKRWHQKPHHVLQTHAAIRLIRSYPRARLNDYAQLATVAEAMVQVGTPVGRRPRCGYAHSAAIGVATWLTCLCQGVAADDASAVYAGGSSAVAMGTLVVIISVLFERAQRFLRRRVSTRTVPIVDALFREWALLGFVGLLFFVSTQTGALESISKWRFGDDEPLRLTQEVQRVDMVRAWTVLGAVARR